MKKSYFVDSNYNLIRLDRWIRNNLCQMPQSLIEKNLRKGKQATDSFYKNKEKEHLGNLALHQISYLHQFNLI